MYIYLSHITNDLSSPNLSFPHSQVFMVPAEPIAVGHIFN